MWCLYNGEYSEHNIEEFYASKNGAEKNLQRMEKEYEKYPGTVVGDFTCIKVEYDWGRRDQRWTVRCNHCGMEKYQYHTRDWIRGKGRKVTCDCRKEEAAAKKKSEAEEKTKKILQNQKEHLHKVYGEWEVIEYNGYSKCRIRCTECGKERFDRIEDVSNGIAAKCNHKIPIDYSSDEWIGKRNGHLTAIGRNGNLFIARCDCGNEITVKPTFMFTYKNRKDCGMPDCPYSTILERKSRERRKRGFEFEYQVEQDLIAKGYNAVKTQNQSDYGVDIIIQEDEGNIAVQCKKQDDPSGVEAVQAVYAGGRYYDCTRFAVISPSGFSIPAITMARKLGVYLCDGEFDFPSDIDAYAKELLPTFHGNEKNKKYYEINGEKKTLGDWCVEYDKPIRFVQQKMKDGVSLENALKMDSPPERTIYRIGDLVGTLSDIGDYFGICSATLSYRMKAMGMTLEEAILATKNRKTA